MLRRTTKYLVVHCSATPPSMDVGVPEIRKWHMEQNGWAAIGYHFVIRRDGTVEPGRHVSEVGAHVQGQNAVALGVCLVGGVDAQNRPDANFTDAQYAALTELLADLSKQYPKAVVRGHRDFPDVLKACPSFDAIGWAKARGFRV